MTYRKTVADKKILGLNDAFKLLLTKTTLQQLCLPSDVKQIWPSEVDQITIRFVSLFCTSDIYLKTIFRQFDLPEFDKASSGSISNLVKPRVVIACAGKK